MTSKCLKCGSEEVVCNIDYLRDAEEEVSTYECTKCHNFWLGVIV